MNLRCQDHYYPNPFNPQTTIRFAIPAEPGREEKQNQVVLNVYNLRGQLVANLIDEELAPGNYTVQWDGKDGRGNIAPSGTYLYKLSWGDKSSIRKMVVLK